MLTPEQQVESHRAASAKYLAKNREMLRTYTNTYYAANKEKILLRRKEKRALLKLEKNKVSVKVEESVIEVPLE
jgi:peptidyl-tRNA hydrolase